MKLSAFTALLFLVLPLAGLTAEKASTKDEIKALILEDAKRAANTPPAATAKTDPTAKEPGAGPTKPVQPAAADAKAPAELEAKLPQVQVNKSKITVLDHELHEQDRKMAFEAKNAKSTELDNALNASTIAPSILGGYNSKVRTGLAQERLELMEFEKELTEAIARAKTKAEKTELKKQLDDIRTMRRTLDASPEPGNRGGR